MELRILTLVLFGSLPPLIFVHFLGVESDLWWFITLPFVVSMLIGVFSGFRHGSISQLHLNIIGIGAAINIIGGIMLREFKSITYSDLTLHQLIDVEFDAIRTIGHLPATKILTFLALFLAVAVLVPTFQNWLVRGVDRAMVKKPVSRLIRLTAGTLVIIYLTLYVNFSAWSVSNIEETQRLFSLYEITSPDLANRHLSGESVIILHLESVTSSSFLNENMEKLDWRIEMPGLNTIWQNSNGVFFPFFWANTRATNRALESILCGVSANFNTKPLVNLASRPPGIKCLPAVLESRGYQTEVWYSYFSLAFYDFKTYFQNGLRPADWTVNFPGLGQFRSLAG